MNEEIEELSPEDQYVADLEAAEAAKPEHRRKPVKPPEAPAAATPAPAQPVEAALEAPEGGEAPVEPQQAPAPVAAAPSPAPVAPPAAAPTELFPGFNTLLPEMQSSIKAKYEEAEAAKRQAADLDRQYKQLHGKTAPLQSGYSKLQVDYTRAQQELQKLKATSGGSNIDALRKRIDALKENFPDDAALFEGVLTEAKAAREENAALREEFGSQIGQLRNRFAMNDEIAVVAAAHPDWSSLKTAFDVPSGQFVPKVDTPEARELCVWANNLDPQEREIIHPRLYSNKATDVVYALNRFKQDKQWAAVVRAQRESGVAPQAPAAPQRQIALPDLDPDPTRRASPPSASTTRNDTSTDEQEYAAAAEIWKQRQRDKARQRS